MRLIDADKLECVSATMPHEASDDYKQGYLDGFSYSFEIIDEQPTITIPERIPVSERMPEEKKQVLVCDAYGFIYTAECEVISDDEWLDWRWYESVEYRPMDDVVAWMPLPEPWRGEEDG